MEVKHRVLAYLKEQGAHKADVQPDGSVQVIWNDASFIVPPGSNEWDVSRLLNSVMRELVGIESRAA